MFVRLHLCFEIGVRDSLLSLFSYSGAFALIISQQWLQFLNQVSMRRSIQPQKQQFKGEILYDLVLYCLLCWVSKSAQCENKIVDEQIIDHVEEHRGTLVKQAPVVFLTVKCFVHLPLFPDPGYVAEQRRKQILQVVRN